MQQGQHITFRSFRFDPMSERLWRGTQAIALRPKTFAVLRFFVEHAGQLVTKEALLDAVWPDTSVSDVVPIVCVRELRQALGDQADAPHFIETVPRRGYRFIAPVVTAPPVQSAQFKVHSARPKVRGLRSAIRNPLRPGSSTGHTIGMVGREAELAQLRRWLEKAVNGERQTVFVTGEAGIGKTAVVEDFLARASVSQHPWIGRGQCLEHYGAGEAYMPVLDALGRLCRGPKGERLIEILARLAPTWLAQMPSLVSAADLEGLQRQILGATRERMLREMAEAVEALTAERPLVLVLEDLHWSDHSTLDLVSCLAQRQEPARLLLIGTYRPAELHLSHQPLKAIKRELQMHKRCEELPLELLPEAVVGEYLERRFFSGESPGQRNMAKGEARPKAEAASLRQLARLIHRRTDGNPLFVINVVDYLIAQGVITTDGGQWELKVNVEESAMGVPASLRQMIEKQIDGFAAEEQHVLEAASVAGVEFSAAAVAAELGEGVAQSEEQCAELARGGQFLRACGVDEWPDGTVAGRYEFIHTLYQNVLYQRLTDGQRLHLHRRVGERKEMGYGKRAGEIAGELAVHFAQGRDYRRAVQYLQQAAQNALQRYAFREAISHLSKGLDLLKAAPDTPERLPQEIALHISLGLALVATKGYAAPEVERNYSRALELCRRVEATPQLVWALWGLQGFYYVRAELQTARGLGEQIFALVERLPDPGLLGVAHSILGVTLSSLGEPLLARAHLEEGIALGKCEKHARFHTLGLSFAARVLWTLGYPDQALQRNQEALRLARELAHPLTSVVTTCIAALLHIVRGEVQAAQERAEEAMGLSVERGFIHWEAQAMALRGWALAQQGRGEESVTQIRQGLAAYQETGAQLARPMLLGLLAETYRKTGQPDEGLTVATEALALAQHTGQASQEAWLARLKGELLLQAKVRSPKSEVRSPKSGVRSPESEAEECFLQALAIARRQQAKALELRTAMSLSRLWHQQGKRDKARQMLAEIYNWFTEGFDTPDLQEARALLDELGG